MTDVLPNPAQEAIHEGESILGQALNAIANLILPVNKELVTMLRAPTPIKVSQVFTADSNGCIGGGLDTPSPVDLYRTPMSSEAWLNRITITCPDHGPAEPLTSGELVCMGSTSGEIIFFLPNHGDIAPLQIVEGRLSAPHLNAGEVASIVADQLPPGTHLRIDLQITLVSGLSEYTPRKQSPTNLDTFRTVPGSE